MKCKFKYLKRKLGREIVRKTQDTSLVLIQEKQVALLIIDLLYKRLINKQYQQMGKLVLNELVPTSEKNIKCPLNHALLTASLAPISAVFNTSLKMITIINSI